jgi:6,7-dimethyl-8-ribityllumazine synthase
VQSTVGSSDLLGSGDVSLDIQAPGSSLTCPFDAVIAIGVLIKGETMHFEYIANSVSEGLMRVGLDTGVPVIFGLLTVLSESQAMARAGMAVGEMHNHGDDWGSAAVELGSKGKQWAQGKLS